MPTVEELASLIDTTQHDPALPSGHLFSSVQPDYYWSSTTDVGNTSYAWGVRFYDGYVNSSTKTEYIYVWCVRGGHGYDAY